MHQIQGVCKVIRNKFKYFFKTYSTIIVSSTICYRFFKWQPITGVTAQVCSRMWVLKYILAIVFSELNLFIMEALSIATIRLRHLNASPITLTHFTDKKTSVMLWSIKSNNLVFWSKIDANWGWETHYLSFGAKACDKKMQCTLRFLRMKQSMSADE